jgi:3-hydroxyacyl-[acyl-carrier-protein] dehydratase
MRYFLLDRVTELVVGESARGVKNVTLTDEVLHDHFPDHPILPGSLLVEAMAQLSGFLLEMTAHQASGSSGADVKRAVLVQIHDAKFSAPAEPGDRIEIVARLDHALDAAARCETAAFVDGQRIARAQLTFMLKTVPVPADRVHEERRRLYRLWTKKLGREIDIP